jgi:hypothetical protein
MWVLNASTVDEAYGDRRYRSLVCLRHNSVTLEASANLAHVLDLSEFPKPCEGNAQKPIRNDHRRTRLKHPGMRCVDSSRLAESLKVQRRQNSLRDLSVSLNADRESQHHFIHCDKALLHEFIEVGSVDRNHAPFSRVSTATQHKKSQRVTIVGQCKKE